MEMARYMMIEKKLLFWGEVVHTIVYLLDMLPIRSMQGMILVEAQFDSKPSAEYLKALGSTYYTHVPVMKRGKLDEKVKNGIFMDYAMQSKGYRVHKIEAKKVLIYKDVKINEDLYWDWKINQVEYSNSYQQKTRIVPAILKLETTDYDIDLPPEKIKSLFEIYERCNPIILEPSIYVKVSTKKSMNSRNIRGHWDD